MLPHYLGKIGILDDKMFHSECMKINVLFFVEILPRINKLVPSIDSNFSDIIKRLLCTH